MNQRAKYVLRRIGFTILSFYIVATLIFFIFRFMPGDPSTAVVAPGMDRETRNLLLQQYGLTEPIHVQYYKFIINLITGNLGISFSRGQQVTPILINNTLNTLSLMLTAVVLSFLLGPLIGAYLGWHRGSRVDSVGTGVILVLRGAPVFWTGMLGLMLFSFQLGWLPTRGMHSIGYEATSLTERFISVDFLWHLVLPLTVTTLYYLTIPIFVMRNNMIEVLGADFIELCRAQGLSETSILYRHAARNSLLPVLHYAAVAIGFAFGGSVVIETVFSWPGVGHTIIEAVSRQDYPLAQGAFLMISFMIIFLNLVADVISVYADPRATMDGE